jgi:diguanylate cyclase (GGDEF)-like protein/PAS domain S-box-containing protein
MDPELASDLANRHHRRFLRTRLLGFAMPLVAAAFILLEVFRRLAGADWHPDLQSGLFIVVPAALQAGLLWWVSTAVGKQLERQELEHAKLEESTRQLASIVESTEDAIIGKTLDGTVLTWNAAATTLYGYTEQEMRGGPMSVLVPRDRLEDLKRVTDAATRGDSFKNYRTISVRKDGSLIPVSLTISPLRDGRGAVIGTSTIARDITKQLQEETELKEAHAKLKTSLAELELRNHSLSLFSEMADLLDNSRSAEETYPILADFGRRIFSAECGALYVPNSTGRVYEAAASWGEPSRTLPSFPADQCWAIRLKKPHIANSKDGMVCQHAERLSSETFFCIPLLAQGELAALLFVSMAATAAMENSDLGRMRQRLATTFCERTSLSLSNLKLREQLRLQSIRDPLTGLFNRSYLEETLEREISRAIRNQSTVGIIMMDLDHFKDVNDTFGHDAGDFLLREVGQFLSTHVRKHDIVCRYGGEEFTLILPDASLEDTAQRAEQLRRRAREIDANYEGCDLGSVRFSLGVASFPKDGSSAAAVLKEADRSLYRAKAEGRDRVVIS